MWRGSDGGQSTHPAVAEARGRGGNEIDDGSAVDKQVTTRDLAQRTEVESRELGPLGRDDDGVGLGARRERIGVDTRDRRIGRGPYRGVVGIHPSARSS